MGHMYNAIERETAIRGRPRLLTLVPIESTYVTSYISAQ